MSEKLKESHNGLTDELYETLEKLQNTERGISHDIIRTLVKVLKYYDIGKILITDINGCRCLGCHDI